MRSDHTRPDQEADPPPIVCPPNQGLREVEQNLIFGAHMLSSPAGLSDGSTVCPAAWAGADKGRGKGKGGGDLVPTSSLGHIL